MKKNGIYCALVGLVWMTNIMPLLAQSASKALWTQQKTPLRSIERSWYPKSYQSFSLDLNGMQNLLASVPMQKSAANHSSEYIIELPMPDGSFHQYAVVESPIMEPALAAQFPEIKTYAGQGIDDKTATIRCDITHFGFHGYVLSPYGIVYIDPVSLNATRDYIVYYKKDIPVELFILDCSVRDEEESIKRNDVSASTFALDGNLRTYRLAMAADYEYCQYYGGTVGGALSGITTTMNRVNGVYEKELDIHMNLIGGETSIIYAANAGYNASNDPYTNNDPGVILGQNQNNIDAVIGPGNYDIGHVVTTGAGGIAAVGCVCGNGQKASGATGNSNPTGDGFDVDYVCHEMGHQFGASHTFNAETGACASPNRASYTAYEPGSGSTIMAYAGICGANDLQPHTDAYFHTRSFDDIILYSQNGLGNGCASLTPSGNLSPVIVIPGTYNIPINTSFRLSASATDPDGGAVTYCWEEYDKSGLQTGQSWDDQRPGNNSPIFRSFTPTSNPERIFPKWSSIINDTTIIGEVLPAYARQLHFRCTARDNNSGCGGVTESTGSAVVNVLSVNGLGFAVTHPSDAGIEWDKRKEHTIKWETAGTKDNAAINTPYVNIYLSLDGGNTFSDTVGMHIDNLGSYSYTLPSWIVNSPNTSHWDNARIMIEAEGNIFFDVSNHNFRIDTVDVLEPLDSSFVVTFINLNVVTNAITFKLEAPMDGNFGISIYNSIGVQVMNGSLEKTTQLVERTIDVATLPAGMYIIRFDGPDYSLKKKFVKIHPK